MNFVDPIFNTMKIFLARFHNKRIVIFPLHMNQLIVMDLKKELKL